MRGWIALGLLTLATATMAAEPVAFHAGARVALDANGTPTDIEVSKDLPEAIRTAIERKIATWQFAPPSRDGVVSDGVTYLSLGACAVPVADGYAMAIDYKSNGPRLTNNVRLPPPAYPIQAMRNQVSADLAVHYIVETDGHVSLERIDYLDGTKGRRYDFKPVIRDWLKELRYEPEQLAGVTVRTKLTVPLRFSSGSSGSDRDSREERLNRIKQSPECQAAASKLPGELQPVAVDSPFKLLNQG